MTDKNLTLAFLKELRAAGVKRVLFTDGGAGVNVVEAEFFPRSILDVSGFADGAGDESDSTETPTERPPASESTPIQVAPAFARILGKQSVS